MDIPKLLIASASPEFIQSISHALQCQMQIRHCHNGRQALELLLSFRPDLLLIDLALPDMDGLAVLQAASRQQTLPKTVVTMDLRTPYILSALTRLGVSYALIKPCDPQAIQGHLLDLAAPQEADLPLLTEECSRETVAAHALVQLGMYRKWNGFDCLQMGIPLFADDPAQAVTKELYTDLGKPFGKNAKQVERNIRSAITKAWERGDPAVWRLYFPTAPDGTVPRPTNKVFIAHMAQILYAEREKNSA